MKAASDYTGTSLLFLFYRGAFVLKIASTGYLKDVYPQK